MHEQITASVEQLTSSEAWARMLAAAARFHSYSFRNVVLVVAQCPAATKVARFGTWKSLGRSVREGEKGIAILAPCTYRTKPDGDQDLDVEQPKVGQKPEQESGSGRRQLRGFKVAYVFDVSQTEGEPLPDVAPQLLAGEAPSGLWDSLAAHVAELGYRLRREDCGTANGYADGIEKVVVVRPDLDPAQAVKTLAHELAHILLGHTEAEYPCASQRLVAEVAAESVAAIVCGAAGMDTASYTAPYVAGWVGGDTDLITRTGNEVVAAATDLIARHLDENSATGLAS